jgi:diacylglycerol kinase (ATP)
MKNGVHRDEERLLLIVNGAAGGGQCGLRADAAIGALRQAGLSIEVVRTARAGHATELARRGWEDGFRKFVCVGGDGTSYEVVNGLLPSTGGPTPTLGFLPLGTGNSFLRDFSIVDAEAALGAIRRGKTRKIDAIRIEHDAGVLHYINLLSIGFSATVGDLTNRRYKRFGPAGYALAVVNGLVAMAQPRFPYSLDGGARDERACTFLSFCNSKFTGGTMMMAPAADTGDGELDVVRVAPMGRLALLRAFPKIYEGTHVRLPTIETARARRVEFAAGPKTPVMIDGEVVDLSLRALEVVPGALEVMA